MWKEIRISGFRGIRQLTLKDLRRVNLIAGPNNAGKTNLLEALFLHAGGGNAELAIRVNVFRGLLPSPIQVDSQRLVQQFLGTLFYRANLDTPIEIRSQDEAGGTAVTRFQAAREPAVTSTLSTQPGVQAPTTVFELGTLQYERSGKEGREYQLLLTFEAQGSVGIRVEPPPVVGIPGIFVTASTRSPVEDANRLGMVIQEGRLQEVVDALKVLEPHLQSLVILPYLGVPYIYADLGDRPLLPLAVAGEGLERLARILLAVASSRGGVVLVDEVENGFHFSVLIGVWRAVIKAAERYDVQLFLTTHDWETVVAAHRAFQEAERYDEFRYMRLERGEDGEIRVVNYTEEALEAAIQGGLEVR